MPTLAMQRATTITTMSQLPRAGQHTYQFIDRLVARVSTLQLIFGNNFEAIPEIIVGLLGTPSPANVSNREQSTVLISVIIPVVNEARFLPGRSRKCSRSKLSGYRNHVVDSGLVVICMRPRTL